MVSSEIQKLLADDKQSLIEIYFEIQKQFEEKYGKDTVVVIEVGSFFEVYGVDNDEIQIGKPKEIAEILNLQLTRKNKTIEENSIKNPLLAGFPTATFDRYISRLIQENKYTIVVIRQAGVPPKITRYIDRIISPGINFDYSLDHGENFIVSLMIDEQNGIYSAGYTALDVTTGKTFLQEIYSTKEDSTFALDEVFRLLQTYKTSEIVLTCAGAEEHSFKIEQYLEIFDNVKINKKRLKVSYQNELFKRTYIIKSFLTPIEYLDLERRPLASESLALLLEFVIDHDYQVIQKLEKPTILNNSNYLYLGNNPLEQLNIISRDSQDLTVLKLVDHTITSMGKRLLKERLLNPITNKEEIEQRYNLSDAFQSIYHKIDYELKNVYDLERIIRRIQLHRLHPFEINFLYESLLVAQHVFEIVSEKDISHTLSLDNNKIQNAISFLEHTFNLNETAKVTYQGINGNLFQTGFDKELDELIFQKEKQENKLHFVRNKIIEILNKQTGKDESDYVEIVQLDKEGHHISLTRSRFALIEPILKSSFFSIDEQVYAFSDFTFKVQTSNVKMSSKLIDSISEEIVILQARIVALTKESYLKQLEKIEEQFIEVFIQTTEFLSRIDVAVSNCKAMIAHNLIRPEIIEAEKSFIEIQDLRHILVEAREENGIYVPNDIFLGSKENSQEKSVFTEGTTENIYGALLYGINSSGKSSLMKSVGVAVILAQSGFYVPATQMRFSLFSELFTRILSRDNFEKGLSSFGVEMMELKNIFNRCTERSLILGDEISHGTETLSALAIVSAAIEYLAEQKTLFFFTTHLHQLVGLERIKKLKSVVSVHLSVKYNKEEDKLIFERKLQPGSGSSIYGLEFAESLHLNKDFLQKALAIRKELAADYEELELLTKKQKSKYHPELFLAGCAICQNPVEDTHHIVPQEQADEQGNVGYFHKNHKYNLLPLCKNCHLKVHEGKLSIRGFVMTSQGLEIDYEERV